MFSLELHNIFYNFLKDVIEEGFKEHQLVMIEKGYARFTRHEVSVPASNFLIIRLNTNDINEHQSALRLLDSSNENLRFKIYIATENINLFPELPIAMPIFNQVGLIKETPSVNVQAEFFAYAPQASNPFEALQEADNVPLFVPGGGVPASPTPGEFSDIKNRNYLANNTYAVVIQNLGTSPTNIYYQYNWHEY